MLEGGGKGTIDLRERETFLRFATYFNLQILPTTSAKAKFRGATPALCRGKPFHNANKYNHIYLTIPK